MAEKKSLLADEAIWLSGLDLSLRMAAYLAPDVSEQRAWVETVLMGAMLHEDARLTDEQRLQFLGQETVIHQLRHNLAAKAFRVPFLQHFYRTITEMWDKGDEVSPGSVAAVLEERHELLMCGGEGLLLKLPVAIVLDELISLANYLLLDCQ